MSDRFEKIPIKIFGSGTQNKVYDDQDEQAVTDTIRQQVLPGTTAQYRQVNVKVKRKPDGTADYLLAYLLRKDTYTSEVRRIDVDQDFKVTDIKEDYDDSQEFNEEDTYEWESEDTATYAYDMVVATPCDDITSTVNAVNHIDAMAREMGLNTKKLIGAQATLTNYRRYLTSGLKGFVNIGHGNPNSISL